MKDFLEQILATKAVEIHQLQEAKQGFGERRVDIRSFAAAITASPRLAVVAEVKKASPSKGVIQPHFDPLATAQTYEAAGASCVSVLTDQQWFQGDIAYLKEIRAHVGLPVLRKDFIIDELQIDEAYAAGADAVLLICAALSAERLRILSRYAKDLGLDVLIEIHNQEELDAALHADPSVIGVNNRNLTTFEVDLATSEKLIPQIPPGIPSLAESGIRSREDAERMARAGAQGVLVGESLMRSQDGGGVADALKSLQVVKVTPCQG